MTGSALAEEKDPGDEPAKLSPHPCSVPQTRTTDGETEAGFLAERVVCTQQPRPSHSGGKAGERLERVRTGSNTPRAQAGVSRWPPGLD